MRIDAHPMRIGRCIRMANPRSRCPSVKTLEELNGLKHELQAIMPDTEETEEEPVPVWLSVTRGKIEKQLLDVDIVEVGDEGVWRDYYTGEQLENYTKPWMNRSVPEDDCVTFYPHGSWDWESYFDYDSTTCIDIFTPAWCPCQRNQPKQSPPLLLRGLCSSSNLRTEDFTRGLWFAPRQLISDFRRVFFVGGMSTRIDYNRTKKHWILQDLITDTNATSLSIEHSYVLGKHNWTIKNDNQRCHEEKGQGLQEYRTELKLSGCNQGFIFDEGGNMLLNAEGEFTCDDGQCVSMSYRCDHLPHCKDGSDEKGCNLLTLTEGYNKIVPPFSRTKSGIIIPISVDVSLRLLTVLDIDENENTLNLQFEIILDWKDYRVSYSNLKDESFLNALTKENIESIWLPLVIYENTNQKESTQLSYAWRTSAIVAREGNFTR